MRQAPDAARHQVLADSRQHVLSWFSFTSTFVSAVRFAPDGFFLVFRAFRSGPILTALVEFGSGQLTSISPFLGAAVPPLARQSWRAPFARHRLVGAGHRQRPD